MHLSLKITQMVFDVLAILYSLAMTVVIGFQLLVLIADSLYTYYTDGSEVFTIIIFVLMQIINVFQVHYLVMDFIENWKLINRASAEKNLESDFDTDVFTMYKWERCGKSMTIGITVIHLLFIFLGTGMIFSSVWDEIYSSSMYAKGLKTFILMLFVCGLIISLVTNVVVLVLISIKVGKRESVIGVYMVLIAVCSMISFILWMCISYGEMYEIRKFRELGIRDMVMQEMTWFSGLVTQIVFISILHKVRKTCIHESKQYSGNI